MANQTPLPPAAPPTAPATSLLPILISQGVLNAAQAGALPAQADNATIELYLRLNHLVSEEQLLQAYAVLYQIPFIHLANRKIKPDILRLIPEMTARRYDIVAYDKQGDVVLVALSSPRRFRTNQRVGLLHRLQAELQIKIAPSLAPLEEIRAAFVGYENNETITVPEAAAPVPTAPTNTPTFPVISLVDRPIADEVLKLVPESVARHYGFVAFAAPSETTLSIAATDPAGKATQQVIEYLQKQNGLTVTLYQTDQASLERALIHYGPTGAGQSVQAPVAAPTDQLPGEKTTPVAPAGPRPETPQAKPAVTPASAAAKAKSSVLEVTADELIYTGGADVSKTTPATATNPLGKPAEAPKAGSENTLDQFLTTPINSIQDLIALVRSGNVPKMVAGIISYAITLRASDIHIEAEKDKIRLRYRVDGELEEVLMVPRVLLAPLVSRIKILSQMKIDENRVPQDGRFGVMVKNRDIDLRVSTLPTVYGEKVVIRILDKTTGIMSLEDMGLDGDNLKRLITNIEKPYGIVLSTGPTGSGKSTTLYAVLQRISQKTNNVVTLEDPVEYEMDGINQTQIKPKIGFTFAEGLRSILRQDPNIIMVGEIRDKETAEMATHAALTGHLVLSTLHTNSAAGALPRLINMGIEPFLITSSINAVEAQRLVRRVCQDCKVEEQLPEGVIAEITQELATAPIEASLKEPANWHFYRGKGCPNCHNGYRGRIGIFEVIPMSEEIEALAVKKAPASVIEQQAIKEGMITMKQDGIVKALHGLTTVEEVMKATTE